MSDLTAYVAGSKLQFGKEECENAGGERFIVPYGLPPKGILVELVSSTGVDLGSRITWHGRQDSPFIHEEIIKDRHVFNYNGVFRFSAYTDYGNRTPILHPAVAAIDATQAGVDDAFLRAMQNVDLMLGGGRREDTGGAIRLLTMKYSKLPYNPVRLLVRAAVVFSILCAEGGDNMRTRYRVTGVNTAPRHIANLVTYVLLCGTQLKEHRDMLYLQSESNGESYMIDVLHSLCSDVCPIDTNMTIANLWPPMNAPVVAYSAVHSYSLLAGDYDLSEFCECMDKFCRQYDCYDLWAECLGFVQGLLCRPGDAGILGGTNVVTVSLPLSDMRIGAIGPLLAGISAEGMRSQAFSYPDPRTYLYSSAVRGVFVSASYYDALQEFADTHPIVVKTNHSNRRHYNMLTRAETGMAFMHTKVAARAVAAGWDVVGPLTKCIYITAVRDYPTRLFRPARVPWWTTVVCHLGELRSSILATWAKPSLPTGRPVPNRWQPYHLVGAVTPVQVGTAIRWLNAQVCYSHIMLGKGMDVFPVEVGSHSRFVPNMMPILPCGGDRLVGALKFPETAQHDFHFVSLLGQSDVFAEPLYHTDQYTEDVYEEGKQGADGPGPTPRIQPTLPDAEAEKAAVEAERPPPPESSGPFMDPEDVAGQLKEFIDGISVLSLRDAELIPSPYLNTAPSLAATKLAAFPIAKLRELADPVTALERVRTLHYALALLLPHADVHAAERLNAIRSQAIRLTLELRNKVELPRRWADEMEEPEAAVAEGVAAAQTAEAQMPAAVDDPVGERVTVADFGDGTSSPASTMGTQPVPDATPPLTETPSIGFAPPLDSQDSTNQQST
jgi:hypothetical protein